MKKSSDKGLEEMGWGPTTKKKRFLQLTEEKRQMKRGVGEGVEKIGVQKETSVASRWRSTLEESSRKVSDETELYREEELRGRSRRGVV